MAYADWIDFFTSVFPDADSKKHFVRSCERLAPDVLMYPVPTKAIAPKIMMHQTKRLISIGDDMEMIRPETDSLQLIWFLICAEHITKLFYDFETDGKSRYHVQKFFDEFLVPSEQDGIAAAFQTPMRKPLGLRSAVNLLYKIRCAVVHDGLYWRFSFADPAKPRRLATAMLKGHSFVIVTMDKATFRSYIIKGCVRAIEKKLEEPRKPLSYYSLPGPSVETE